MSLQTHLLSVFYRWYTGSGIFVSPTGLLIRTGSIGLSFVIWAACGAMSLLGTFVLSKLSFFAWVTEKKIVKNNCRFLSIFKTKYFNKYFYPNTFVIRHTIFDNIIIGPAIIETEVYDRCQRTWLFQLLRVHNKTEKFKIYLSMFYIIFWISYTHRSFSVRRIGYDEPKFRGRIRLPDGCLWTNACVSIFLDIHIDTQTVTGGYNMSEFRQICRRSICRRMRFFRLCSENRCSTVYLWVQAKCNLSSLFTN